MRIANIGEYADFGLYYCLQMFHFTCLRDARFKYTQTSLGIQ